MPEQSEYNEQTGEMAPSHGSAADGRATVSYTHLTLPDERSSVDLGGRRIIKKKRENNLARTHIR